MDSSVMALAAQIRGNIDSMSKDVQEMFFDLVAERSTYVRRLVNVILGRVKKPTASEKKLAKYFDDWARGCAESIKNRKIR